MKDHWKRKTLEHYAIHKAAVEGIVQAHNAIGEPLNVDPEFFASAVVQGIESGGFRIIPAESTE